MTIYEKIKAPEKKQKTVKRSFLKKRHVNTIINYPGLKKKKADELKDPANLLHRFHFIELITRISMDKYDKVSPNQALRRFFEENLIPNMKSKVLAGCRLSHELLYKRFFCNEKVGKLLFLNQFDLKNIHDKILENEPEDPLGPLTSIIKALSIIDTDMK